MPKTLGGFFGWLIDTIVIVAVGVAILSRIPGVWGVVNNQPGA